ncbi:hypothetical protein BDV97DRAFT_291157 [Delphinella strobiligena]|nr:hypothetical protein BDV97DRAFT_291157 [Delphinella strobiligena]
MSIVFISSVYSTGTTDSTSAAASTSTVNIQSTSTTIQDTTLSGSSSTTSLNTGTETVEVGPPLVAGPATSTSVWTYTSVGTYSPPPSSSLTTLSTSISTTSTSIAAVSTYSPSVQIVDVGDATNKFSPDVLTANVGDIISFRFFPANHSVVQAEYGFPCIPLSTMNTSALSFFSGFFPIASMPSNPPIWNLTVNDTEPFFFYCSAPGSCLDWQMVGGVNLNSSTNMTHHIAAIAEEGILLQPGEPWQSEDQESSIASFVGPTAAPYMSISSKSSAGHAEALSAGVIAGIAIAGFLVVVLAGVALWFMSRSHTLKQALHMERKAAEEVVNSFNGPHSTQNLDLHGSLDGPPFRSSGIADQGGSRDSRRWSGPSGGLHGTSHQSLEDTTCRGPGLRSPISPMTLGAVCGPGLAELEEKPNAISEIAGDEPARQEMGGSDPDDISVSKDGK